MPIFSGLIISEAQLAEAGYVPSSSFYGCLTHGAFVNKEGICPQCNLPKQDEEQPPKQGRVTTGWGGKHGYFPPKHKFGRVRPEYDDEYFVVYADGTVAKEVWKKDTLDLTIWAMGNGHLTREAAELAVARQQAKVRVIDALAERKEKEIDWEGEPADRCFLTSESEVECGWSYQDKESELYSTHDAVEWVAENMGEDVKLYLTGETE